MTAKQRGIARCVPYARSGSDTQAIPEHITLAYTRLESIPRVGQRRGRFIQDTMSHIGFKESSNAVIGTGRDGSARRAKVFERERSLLTRSSAVFSLKLLSRAFSLR
jgi:hypothetical protein